MKPKAETKAVRMVFHKFNHWVWIPLSIYSVGWSLFKSYATLDRVTDDTFVIAAVRMVCYGVLLALLLVAFIGFFASKADGYKANMAILILQLVAGIVGLFSRKYVIPGAVLDIVILTILPLALEVLMIVYYYKRRSLFIPEEVSASTLRKRRRRQQRRKSMV